MLVPALKPEPSQRPGSWRVSWLPLSSLACPSEVCPRQPGTLGTLTAAGVSPIRKVTLVSSRRGLSPSQHEWGGRGQGLVWGCVDGCWGAGGGSAPPSMNSLQGGDCSDKLLLQSGGKCSADHSIAYKLFNKRSQYNLHAWRTGCGA